MWQIDNRTPFAAERCWVRDRDGAEVWLVAVKATFDILPDGSTLVSDDQPPVLQVAEHHAEPGKSSVKYDADLVLTKTTTDVIVVGHAHAPHGAPVAQLDVGFKVGALRKVLRVFGNRTWGLGSPSAPLPFARMPLVYERAYGGIDHASKTPDTDWDWRNPVGTGFAKSAGNAAGVALPNIEDPNALIGSTGDRPPPAGFGVIASHWQPRVALGGTYDDRWMKTRQPLLAEDLDDRFFQSAPADQQAPSFMVGGESVALLNLSPEAPMLRFVLPRIHLGFETFFFGGAQEIHRQRKLHTVILEPDYPRVSLVWHSSLPCHFAVTKLERTIVTLKTTLSAQRTLVYDGLDGESVGLEVH